MGTEVWDCLSLCYTTTHPAAKQVESGRVEMDIPLRLSFPGKSKLIEAKAFLAQIHSYSMKYWRFHSQEWRFPSQTSMLISFL